MGGRERARLQALGKVGEALFRELEGRTPAELEARPPEGGWSPLEVLEHLLLAEEEILQGLPDPAALEARPRRLRHRLRRGAVWLVLRLHIPVRAPAPGMLPRGGQGLEDLRGRWAAHRRWLEEFAASGPDRLGRAWFRHPVAGPLTLAQALTLDLLHWEGHLRSLRRTPPGGRP